MNRWTGKSSGEKCVTCGLRFKEGERVLIHQTSRWGVYIHLDCLTLILADDETFAVKKKLLVEAQLVEIAETEARFQAIRRELALEHGGTLA